MYLCLKTTNQMNYSDSMSANFVKFYHSLERKVLVLVSEIILKPLFLEVLKISEDDKQFN